MTALSVIVPAYNEEENIAGALEDVLRDVGRVVPDLEIVVVDDGSRDATAARVGEFVTGDSRIVLIRQPNQGHGAALANGIEQARGRHLLLIDSDRQVSLADFARHWDMTGKYDVILGIRTPRSDPPHRRLVSRLMRLLIGLRAGRAPRDAGAPYKLLRTEVWREARPFMREGCWIPSVLLATRVLQRRDIASIELPVEHRERAKGPSTLNLRRLLRFCREGVADIEHFCRLTRAARGATLSE
ncbi:MAG: glycosyltransferase family 2 protein [Parvibaculaceae bacterium]